MTVPVPQVLEFDDLKNIPWLFEGKGDAQFDVYREMQRATKLAYVSTDK